MSRKGVVYAAWVAALALLVVFASGQVAKADGLKDVFKMVMHLKQNEALIQKLGPEQIMRLLKGIDRLSEIPFVDTSALLRVRLMLTLRLIALQMHQLRAMAERPHFKFKPAHEPPHRFKPELEQLERRPKAKAEIRKVETFTFFSAPVCRAEQAKVAHQNHLKPRIFVGPCQMEGWRWTFTVWAF